MNYREFVGQNTMLAPPVDWDNSGDQKCGTLPIMRTSVDGIPMMVSIWQPTAEEIEQIKAGHSVRLVVSGLSHPPVSIDVVDVELLP